MRQKYNERARVRCREIFGPFLVKLINDDVRKIILYDDEINSLTKSLAFY